MKGKGTIVKIDHILISFYHKYGLDIRTKIKNLLFSEFDLV